MSDSYDIMIRHASLRNQPGRMLDIVISDGKIQKIENSISESAPIEIDAQGNLVTESFVNTHLHLCKVWTLDMMHEESLKSYQEGSMGNAMSAIEQAAIIKENYDASWITENARKAVALAAYHGNLHIRAFADVDSKARLEGVKALIAVREEFEGVVDLQVVAFAQDGLMREPEAEELMHEAMKIGADVVGGIPWIEFTDEDAKRHVQICFDLAEEFDADVSMLLDDAGDAGLRTLEIMALEALERGWVGRALAHHCRAMSLYPSPYFHRLAALLKKARVPIVSAPHTGPLHARVQELLAANILVCLGQDDISDAYYPYGRNNMLEVAYLASHLLWMTTKQEIEQLYDMITVDAARCINLSEFEIRAGAPAHLVVLGEPDTVEALRYHTAPRHVISHGKIVDQQRMAEMSSHF